MAVIDQKVAELGVKIDYLEERVAEGNGWVEYKKLVLANQDESKLLMQSLVEKVINLEKRNDTIDQIQEKVITIEKQTSEQVDKSEFDKIKKLVEGTDEKPGVRDMLKIYRRLNKIMWVVITGIVILLCKGWVVGLLSSSPPIQ